MRAADVGTGFRLLLDVECFNHLSDEQRAAVGTEVDAVAGPEAAILLLVWARARRGPFLRVRRVGTLRRRSLGGGSPTKSRTKANFRGPCAASTRGGIAWSARATDLGGSLLLPRPTRSGILLRPSAAGPPGDCRSRRSDVVAGVTETFLLTRQAHTILEPKASVRRRPEPDTTSLHQEVGRLFEVRCISTAAARVSGPCCGDAVKIDEPPAAHFAERSGEVAHASNAGVAGARGRTTTGSPTGSLSTSRPVRESRKGLVRRDAFVARHTRTGGCRRAYVIGVFASDTTVPTTKAAAPAGVNQPGAAADGPTAWARRSPPAGRPDCRAPPRRRWSRSPPRSATS